MSPHGLRFLETVEINPEGAFPAPMKMLKEYSPPERVHLLLMMQMSRVIK